MVSIELGEVITNTVTVIVSYCLREPLCELTDPVLIYERFGICGPPRLVGTSHTPHHTRHSSLRIRCPCLGLNRSDKDSTLPATYPAVEYSETN